MLTNIIRGGRVITLPQDVLDSIYANGSYISLNKVKRSYGFYACAMVCKKEGQKLVSRIPLHRLIMNAPKGKYVDHIDQNPLNNDPKNLRFVSVSQNGANRKKSKGTKYKYKGIIRTAGIKDKPKGFGVVIKCKGITYRASTFSTQEEAAEVYNKLAKFLFGEHAGLNEILD